MQFIARWGTWQPITFVIVSCKGLLLSTALAAPADKNLALLTTFRQEFINITPGQKDFPAEFLMGSQDGDHANERPAHRVTFARPFAMAKYEVPQDLWEAVRGTNPSHWTGPRNSVEMVSFDDAQDFCQRVTQELRAAGLIQADQEVRLPSEAEWEYAARAGTSTRYSFGDDAAQLTDYGWFTGNAAGNDPPVGAKRANPWGLYDVHGYLWEWCLDHGHDNYVSAPTDGTAWTDSPEAPQRILRGGSWKDPADRLTSRYRRLADRQLRDDAVGVRCVLAPVAADGSR